MFTTDDMAHIGLGLQDCCLPKSEWTHAAHIAAAVWLLDRYGEQAFNLMPDMIRRYNASVGGVNSDHEGYHHTITLASLRVIQSEISGKNETVVDQVNSLLTSGFDKPDWLMRYYSKDLLFSAQARRAWVDPDLLPLP